MQKCLFVFFPSAGMFRPVLSESFPGQTEMGGAGPGRGVIKSMSQASGCGTARRVVSGKPAAAFRHFLRGSAGGGDKENRIHYPFHAHLCCGCLDARRLLVLMIYVLLPQLFFFF